jgi:hypothetical protein
MMLWAQAAFEWTLLASFQSDLRLFRRTNEAVQFAQQAEVNGPRHRQVSPPIIIAPDKPIPAADIISYDPKRHAELIRLGYKDAREDWIRAGKSVV